MLEEYFRAVLLGEREIRLTPVFAEPGSCVVDVGANSGIYSQTAARSGARVVAYEPIADIAMRLQDELGPANSVHQVALSDHPDRAARLFVPRINSRRVSYRASLVKAAVSGMRKDRITVRTECLDTYNLDNVSLIKVDVEGHEWEVLCGADSTIRRSRPTLIVEVEERHAPGNIQRVGSYMADRGYTGWFISGDCMLPIQQFSVALHQRPDIAPKYGVPRSSMYINNFIWIPQNRPELVDVARQTMELPFISWKREFLRHRNLSTRWLDMRG